MDTDAKPRAAYNGFGHETSTAYADAHEEHLYAAIALAAASGRDIRVLDLACGMGTTSLRLAQAGAKVTAVDLNPDTRAVVENSPLKDQITFVNADIRALPESVCAQKYDFILFQRALDCMPADDGMRVLKTANNMLKANGSLYMTVSSPQADYAEGYEGKDKPLSERFHKLAPEFQQAHHFFQPICMWSKKELANVLRKQNWRTSAHFLSAQGSNKVIAFKKGLTERLKRPMAQFAAAAGLMLALLPFAPKPQPTTNILSDQFASAIGNATHFAVKQVHDNGEEKTVLLTNPALENTDKSNYQELSPSRWPMQRIEISVGGAQYAVYREPSRKSYRT